MKVCYVTTDVIVPHYRGASTHTYEMASHLVSLGNEVHVILRRLSRKQAPYEVIDGVHFHRVFRGIWRETPYSSYKWLKQRSGVNPILSGIYHVYLRSIYVIYAAYFTAQVIKRYGLDIVLERETSYGAGALASILTKRPLITEINGPRYSCLSLRRAKKVLVYSPLMIPKTFPAEKLELVDGAANTHKFKPMDASEIREKYGLRDFFVVGYIGIFAEWHGVEDIVNAGLIVLKQKPNIRFLMVGPYYSSTKKLAHTLGLDDTFVFTGPIPYDLVSKYMNACDVLVAPYNPTRTQIFKKTGMPYSPLKVFEYMACGKPVITTSTGPLLRIIENGKTGLLVPPGNIEDLASAIIKLYDDPKLVSEIGKRARVLVLSRYSWRKLAENLQRMFKDVYQQK